MKPRAKAMIERRIVGKSVQREKIKGDWEGGAGGREFVNDWRNVGRRTREKEMSVWL
jgi:hypothetical protein